MYCRIVACALVASCSCAPALAQECDPTEVASFNIPGNFGWTIAMGDGIAVIGAPEDSSFGSRAGAVYIYKSTSSGWVFQSILTSSDIESSDLFGETVAISDGTILIGAPGDDDHGSRSGSAYIFDFDGTNWNQTTKLTASDAGGTDAFGSALAIVGSTAVIGATRNDELGTNAGAAYIFELDAGTWSESARLLASDGEAYDAFGVSIAVTDTFVVVGAAEDDDLGNSSGSIYVFTSDGTQWSEQSKITPIDGAASDFFGESIAASGSRIIAGAYWDDDAGSNSGSAYIYEYDAKGGWNQQAKLIAPDGNTQDQFGIAVSISGDTVIIGANRDDVIGSDTGSAYMFQYIDAQWEFGSQLIGSQSLEDDEFGEKVALWGTVAAITSGDQAGRVYLYDLACSCPADFTGDGILNFFDVSAFLQAFAAQDPAADFTNDGNFDFFDIGQFIGLFGAGCP